MRFFVIFFPQFSDFYKLWDAYCCLTKKYDYNIEALCFVQVSIMFLLRYNGGLVIIADFTELSYA